MNKELEDKILNKIKQENIKPRPFWYFLLKDYSLWSLVLLSIILAALSIAPILFIFSNLEYGFVKHISNNLFVFILTTLPYHWLLLLFVTTFLAKLAWRRTKNGYKFEGKYIIIISTILSLIFGIILNQLHLGKKLDENIKDPVFNSYKSVEGRYEENWFSPSEGRVLGVIVSLSTTSFEIYNKKNNLRQTVTFSDDVPGVEFINTDNKVRVVGFQDSDNNFFACAILSDNFLPPRERSEDEKKDFQIKMKENKERLKQIVALNPECKDALDKGRANFKKEPMRKN